NACAAAEKLNELGVGLTVHTVGFGLPENEAGNATEQLQCMAENTRGRFFRAGNAAELHRALTQISKTSVEAKPAPEPKGSEVTFPATNQQGGPRIKTGLIWIVRDGGNGDIVYESDEPEGTLTTMLTKGIHDVSVVRVADEASAEG